MLLAECRTEMIQISVDYRVGREHGEEVRPPHGVPDAAQNVIVLSSRALAHQGVITTSANLLIVSL